MTKNSYLMGSKSINTTTICGLPMQHTTPANLSKSTSITERGIRAHWHSKTEPPAQTSLDYISHQHQQEKKVSRWLQSLSFPKQAPAEGIGKDFSGHKIREMHAMPSDSTCKVLHVCARSSLSRQFPYSLWLPLVCRRMCILPTHSIAPSSLYSPGKLAEVWSSFDCQAAANGWAEVNWFRGCKTKTTVLYGGIYYPIQPQAESPTPSPPQCTVCSLVDTRFQPPTSSPNNFPVKSASFFSPVPLLRSAIHFYPLRRQRRRRRGPSTL